MIANDLQTIFQNKASLPAKEEILFLGFDEVPARPDDYEAFGFFIVERRPDSALITTVLPLIFISWFGVFGTLIPIQTGEKLRLTLFFYTCITRNLVLW